jgi:hypothetical protein
VLPRLRPNGAALLAFLLAAPVPALYAQAAPPVTIRVRVVDSSGVAIPGAGVAIMDGLRDTKASGSTDGAGRVTLIVPGGTWQHEVVARRIGYQRASLFFVPHHDTVSLTLALRRPAQQLEAVRVTAREDVKHASYHLDAEDITNSPRTILDGMDAVMKLRPDVMYGRDPLCGGAQDIWVNGKLMRGVLPNAMVQARRGITPSPKMKSMSGRPLPMPKPLTGNEAVQTVLAAIKPEHILEMEFKDCYDRTVDKVHGNSALFVALKEGVAFELNGRGSYVKDLGDLPFVAENAAPPAVSVPAYRNRLLGVYDATTGDPVPDVAVTDSLSGTTARTTSTGTVTLRFLPEGESTLRIMKPGYDSAHVRVSISPRDTLPITLILGRVP